MNVDSFIRPLVLASASPRRREVLERLGLEFKVMPADVEEAFLDELCPEENAERLARLKALSTAGRLLQGTVIGCDTLVAVEGAVIGKPRDSRDAKRILTLLSGRTQRVISGLCLIHVPTGREICGHASTEVYTKPMSEEDIEAYVASGECFDKAGAYAIQETGDRFIERLEGSFDNVVGFPTELFRDYLEILARSIPDEIR